jgi:hypothetical protein
MEFENGEANKLTFTAAATGRFRTTCKAFRNPVVIIAGLFLWPIVTIILESRWFAINLGYALIRGILTTASILFLTCGMVAILRRNSNPH